MKVSFHEAVFWDYLSEYGFNGIPLKKGEKIPYGKWKPFISRKATGSEVSNWIKRHGDFNPGIVTGQVSRLVVVDVDDLSLLPTVMEKMPEVARTASVKTPNGAHFYFLTDKPVKTFNNFLDMGIELKGDGAYVVAPVSVVDGIPYLFRSRLDHLQPFPERLLEVVKPVAKPRFQLHPKTATKGAACIEQIATRDIREGERNYVLYVLHNLLIQNGNREDFARAVVTAKNKSLTKPLSDKEVSYVWQKKYKHSCQYVRETLPFIKCENCRYLDRRWKVDNLILQNIDRLPGLSSSDVKVLTIIQTHFDGELPSISRLSRVGKIDWQVTKDALERLKKKGILS